MVAVDVPQRLRELEDVSSLSFQRDPGEKVRTEFPKIATRLLKKRETHDAAVKRFATELNKISDALEDRVLRSSNELKAALEAIDAAIRDEIFAEMNRDEVLVTKEAGYLGESWAAIEGKLRERHAAIRAFGACLEGLEQDRAARAGGELRALVDALLNVAFKSPGEIERLVEADAFELNAVIIANRRAHAELLAMLEKTDVAAGLQAIEAWRARQEAWRTLRHDRAVREFAEELESATFACPAERSALFGRVRARQRSAEAARAGVLGRVRAMRQPGLDSAAVAEAKAKFKEVYDGEDEAIQAHERELEALVEATEDAARARREALRKELHEYGALEDEPDLESKARVIDAVTHDHELEALFRSAGGLKAELRELVAELRRPELVYDHVLTEARRRLDALLCGAELDAVLEKQGKAQQRKSLQDTLERLRKAARTEVAPLLPALEQHLDDLIKVHGLDPRLIEELATARHDLHQITKDIHYKKGERGSNKSAGTSKSKGSRRPGSEGSGGKEPSRPASRAGSQGARSQAQRSVAGATNMTFGEDSGVNMLEVRAIQKRVAMHVQVCELDPGFIGELRGTYEALEQKARCNAAIDAVVERECEGIIATRVKEQRLLAHHVCVYLEHQASDVYETACRLCDFYVKVARAIEENVAKESDMDESMLDELFDLKETLREKDTELEATVTSSSDRLRHAADDAELEEAFGAVLEALNRIEDQYRAYHGDATATSLRHPERQAAEQKRFEGVLCALLGLVTNNQEELPGEDGTGKEGSGESYSAGGDDYRVAKPLGLLVDDLLAAGKEEDEEEPEEEEAHEEESHSDEEVQGFWAGGFLPMPQDEEEALTDKKLEEYLSSRDAHFRPLPDTVADALPEDEKEAYERIRGAVEEHKASAGARAKELAETKHRERAELTEAPEDADGAKCVQDVALPARTIVDMLAGLRDSVVADMEARRAGREKKIAGLTDARLRDFTEELEERLRTHWPRKGRSEVSFRQPREGELIMHRQRKERHLRVVQQRDRAHARDFETALRASEARVRAFSKALQKLESALGKQGSLAGLQGVESKCKKLAAAFGIECEAELRKLEVYTVHEPHKLVQLNEVLVKATRLFSDGGDYSEAEASELKDKLHALERGVEDSVAGRTGEVDGLKGTQAEALTGLGSFQREAEACLQELSLREGLGMKYGAPRRNAQEKLRTEQTRDEAEASHLDALLGALEEACGEVRDADAGPFEPEGGPPPSAIILRLLEGIRVHARRRARYLNFLPKPETLLEELPPAEDLGEDASDGPPPPRLRRLFAGREARPGSIAEVCGAVEATCRDETRALYAREGKEDRLGAAGVPESLQQWLAESHAKMLGEGGYREKAARRLRVQVQRLERLVAKAPAPPDPAVLGAPAAVVRDAERRTRAEAAAARAATEEAFQKRMDAWVQKRDAHRNELRPRLGRPDMSEQLRALCRAESARREGALAAADAARDEVVAGQARAAKAFARRLLACGRRLFLVLDNLVVADDLGWLPGDEAVQKKRKSLKRLLKARRLAGDNPRPEILNETGLSFGQGRGRAFETREWPGLDVSALAAVVPDAAPEDEGTVGTTSPKASPRDAKPPKGKKAPPPKPESPRSEKSQSPRSPAEPGDADGWAGIVAAASAPQEAAVTTAHRVFVKARNAAFQEYLEGYQTDMADVLAHYASITEEEIAWRAKWEQLIAGLCRVSD